MRWAVQYYQRGWETRFGHNQGLLFPNGILTPPYPPAGSWRKTWLRQKIRFRACVPLSIRSAVSPGSAHEHLALKWILLLEHSTPERALGQRGHQYTRPAKF
ncbi:hypothetical protein COCON_G00033220 [Conger conger]|uniref:Uncharacterized protein n=1 Tax=Conger conger TaxID=82655 RepID=A0A9Q1I5K6_CONCO|nr:hypothetical protein COCON_G00033220 [Conger conger]